MEAKLVETLAEERLEALDLLEYMDCELITIDDAILAIHESFDNPKSPAEILDEREDDLRAHAKRMERKYVNSGETCPHLVKGAREEQRKARIACGFEVAPQPPRRLMASIADADVYQKRMTEEMAALCDSDDLARKDIRIGDVVEVRRSCAGTADVMRFVPELRAFDLELRPVY